VLFVSNKYSNHLSVECVQDRCKETAVYVTSLLAPVARCLMNYELYRGLL